MRPDLPAYFLFVNYRGDPSWNTRAAFGIRVFSVWCF